jgi:hypothetical protein
MAAWWEWLNRYRSIDRYTQTEPDIQTGTSKQAIHIPWTGTDRQQYSPFPPIKHAVRKYTESYEQKLQLVTSRLNPDVHNCIAHWMKNEFFFPPSKKVKLIFWEIKTLSSNRDLTILHTFNYRATLSASQRWNCKLHCVQRCGKTGMSVDRQTDRQRGIEIYFGRFITTPRGGCTTVMFTKIYRLQMMAAQRTGT